MPSDELVLEADLSRYMYVTGRTGYGGLYAAPGTWGPQPPNVEAFPTKSSSSLLAVLSMPATFRPWDLERSKERAQLQYSSLSRVALSHEVH